MNPPQIENYRPTEILGRDATGTTWIAYSDEGEAVALKVLDVESVNMPFLEMGMSRLTAGRQHPRLVEILAYDFTVETPYIVTALHADRIERDNGTNYWEPRTLSKIEASLAPIEAWRFIYQLADALAHLHRVRTPHTGLRFDSVLLDESKPANLFIQDFCLGLVGSPEHLDAGDFVPYAPPEQLRMPELFRDRRAERWDVYAFGVVAYRLLTRRFPRVETFVNEFAKRREENEDGRVPIDLPTCADMVEAEEEITWPTPAEDSVEERRRRVIEACLSLDPDTRYIDMREVREVFCGLEDQLAHATDLENVRNREDSAMKKLGGARKLAACFAVLAGLAGAGWAYQFFQGQSTSESNSVAGSPPPVSPSPPTKVDGDAAKPAPAPVGAVFPEASQDPTPYLDKLKANSESVDDVLQLIASREPDGGFSFQVPDGVLGAILNYYQEFTLTHREDPALEKETARAHSIAGELLLGLGDPSEATTELEAAVGPFRRLREEEWRRCATSSTSPSPIEASPPHTSKMDTRRRPLRLPRRLIATSWPSPAATATARRPRAHSPAANSTSPAS